MKTKTLLKEALKAISAASIVILAFVAFGPKIGAVQAAARTKALKSVKAGSITNPYLANDAVTAEKIAEGAVSWSEIASDAVGSDEIADGTITSADIGDGAIVNGDIASGAAIDYSKLNLGSSITSANITDGTIANADISSAAAISSSKINFDSAVNMSGNVGIGTTAQRAILQVAGGMKLFTEDSGTDNGLRVYDEGGTNRYGTLGFYGSRLSLQANSPYDVGILSAAGEGITVKNSTSYVGIGTTAPGAALEVSGLTYTTLNNSVNNSINYPLYVRHLTTGTAAAGIGAAIGLETEDNTGAISDLVYLAGVATNVTHDSVVSDFTISTKTGGAMNEKMRVTGAGYVGIGTTNPGTTLEVNGIIKTKERASATCNADSEGGIYYHSDDSHFYGCDGSNWHQLDN